MVARRFGLHLRRRLARQLPLLGTLIGTLALAPALVAEDIGLRLSPARDAATFYKTQQGALSLITLCLLVFAATTALVHLRHRRVWREREMRLAAEIAELQSRVDRASVFMLSERQILVAWNGQDGDADIEGDPAIVLDLPVHRRVLGFGGWLRPDDAKRLEEHVERLKLRGEGFSLSMQASNGNQVDIDGRAVAGRAVMRIRDVTGDRRERLRLAEAMQRAAAESASLRTLLDAIPYRLWLRDPSGRLTLVNRAYAAAVGARDAEDAVQRNLELVDPSSRDRIRARVADGTPFREQVPAVIGGRRETLDVFEMAFADGSGGLAADVSSFERARIALETTIAIQSRTLHRVPIAIAMFDDSQHLRFYNAAFQRLWQLDPELLGRNPAISEILDRLRADRRLPEQANFREWKQAVIDGPRRDETWQQDWPLPDQRLLQVVGSVDPDGGVTYLFEDITEEMRLTSQFNAVTRVQDETLDSLREGVAVFGSNGRLKLSNPAFASMWALPDAVLAGEPHVDAVVAATPFTGEGKLWAALRNVVTGVHETRSPLEQRAWRGDGSVLDCATTPLPDGATLMTFIDVTASVNAERMLQERNEALEFANRVKNDFVQDVSYQLRSPLQTVTGFVEMLADRTAGPLNERQAEYANHIVQSSNALLALMNNIFDLASIDTGTLELDIGDVDVRQVIGDASAGLGDRLSRADIKLEVEVAPGVGVFRADVRRVRQILFNLLSNALDFSMPGQTITLSARRDAGHVVFSVADQGPGIPAGLVDKVFQRFESHSPRGREKGVGLGLSIVQAFVDLHGGTVTLDTAPGRGTTVTCRFPAAGVGTAAAAE